MQRKVIDTIQLILLSGILCAMVFFVWIHQNPIPQKNLIDLQQDYARHVQHQITQLLEPIVGSGNVKTSAQINLQEVDETIVRKSYHQSNEFTTTTTHYTGPVLKSQHISILLNQDKLRITDDIFPLIQNAVGINWQTGDTLSIQSLPFVSIPFWTFGLSRLVLIRLAGCLIALVFILMGILLILYARTKIQKHHHPVHPNEALWRKVQQISPAQIGVVLASARPEITAFILYHFPRALTQTLTELLPPEYLASVMIHMSHLEQLTEPAYQTLLLQSELLLQRLVRPHYPIGADEKVQQILTHTSQKEAILNHMQKDTPLVIDSLTFLDLEKLSPQNMKILLKYVDKKTAVMALQTAPLAIHKCFADNLPLSVWQKLVPEIQQISYSQTQSQKAQNEIVALLKLLIFNHIIRL